MLVKDLEKKLKAVKKQYDEACKASGSDEKLLDNLERKVPRARELWWSLCETGIFLCVPYLVNAVGCGQRCSPGAAHEVRGCISG